MKSTNEQPGPELHVYHLSYDIMDKKINEKATYADKMRVLLCLIKKTKPHKIDSPNESTLVIQYITPPANLFYKLRKGLKNYYYFYLTLIAVKQEKHIYDGIINENHNEKFHSVYDTLSCPMVTQYKDFQLNR